MPCLARNATLIPGLEEEVREDGAGDRYSRIVIGEDGAPHGVERSVNCATGVKGGEGRVERPVPPMIARGTGSEIVFGRADIVRLEYRRT